MKGRDWVYCTSKPVRLSIHMELEYPQTGPHYLQTLNMTDWGKQEETIQSRTFLLQSSYWHACHWFPDAISAGLPKFPPTVTQKTQNQTPSSYDTASRYQIVLCWMCEGKAETSKHRLGPQLLVTSAIFLSVCHSDLLADHFQFHLVMAAVGTYDIKKKQPLTYLFNHFLPIQ